jgi:PRC-barrel domain
VNPYWVRTLAVATILAAAITLPAIAQDTTVKSPSATTVQKDAAILTLTAEQAKTWIGKPVHSSDGKKIGDVAAFARGTDNAVTEMQADIGGFLGLGETRVRLTPAQFKLQGDRAVLDLTAAQAKDLPKVQK